MRVTEALKDQQRYKKEVNAQLRRAEMRVVLRRKKREWLRAQTGLKSRKPQTSVRSF